MGGAKDTGRRWFCPHCELVGQGEPWPHEVAYGHDVIPLSRDEFVAIMATIVKREAA